MPVTLSAEEFAKKYGGASGGAPLTLSADEFLAKYGPREAIAERKINPSAAATGDPRAKPESLLEQAAPMIAHPIDALAGGAAALNPIPMLRDPQMYQHIGNEIVGGQGSAREAARQRLAARGSKLWTGDPTDPQAGQDLRDMFTWAVPLFGKAMADAGQQMESPNPETRARGGGAAVALTSGPSAINRTAGAIGGALEKSGVPPLTESLGSQLVAKGKVLSPAEDIRVPKFKSPDAQQAQLANLAEKYPQADIHDGGSDFVVRAAKPTAEPMAQPTILDRLGDIAKSVGKNTTGAIVGGIAGKLVDHPVLGAELGAAAQATIRNLIQSPLWKATSGAVKTAVGRAMQAQDFNTVTTLGARVLGGEGLSDEFGHDSALHGLVDSITQHGTVQMSPPELRQALDDYDAVYVNKDGTSVAVPYHVSKQLKDKLSGQ